MAVELQSVKTELEPGVDTRRAMRLLIVDDDVVQQELLKRAAARSGFEIVVAGSCGEAIRHLETEGFECVMLDLELADGDGIEVCKAMVRTKYSGALIIISGTDSRRRSSARAYARSLGIVAQGLPKPVDLSSLRVVQPGQGHPGPARDPRLGRRLCRPHQGSASCGGYPRRTLAPPSTGSVTPVTKLASSEARNSAALATSQPVPIF